MTSTTETRPWDLSNVIALVNNLSVDPPSRHAELAQYSGHGEARPRDGQPGRSDETSIDKRDFAHESSGLGDFSKIFHFLGTPATAPKPTYPAQQEGAHSLPFWEQYASDGATYVKPTSSPPRARDDDNGISTAEDTVTDTISDAANGSDSPTLTKAQRKKLRKKQKQEEKERKKILAARMAARGIASESEADYGSLRAPARKASAHTVAAGTAKNKSKQSGAQPAPTTPKPPSQKASAQEHQPTTTQQPPAKLSELPNGTPSQTHSKPTPSGQANAIQSDPHVKATSTASVVGQKPGPTATKQPNGLAPNSIPHQKHPLPPKPPAVLNSTAAATAATPSASLAQFNTPQHLRLMPSSIPPRSADSKPHSMQPSGYNNHKPQHSHWPKPPNSIQPTIIRSREDRNWTLLLKLVGDFFPDRQYLTSPMNLTTHNNHPRGIHVFVDASNIFIGFKDQLKFSRNIPREAHIPNVDLSFDALALLMERRRPVARRVLVGSNPHLPAFDKAREVGYECSILDRVMKARELTERQIYFNEREEHFSSAKKRTRVAPPPANNVVSAPNGGSGNVSETNNTAPQFAPPRYIEQGVDEILHLKILESVCDVDEPGTIVLATGDAAQAEYSQGFMAMAQRALKKGWSIELVSWSANISSAYKNRQWQEAWGSRFRIILLDDYAEELLDM